MRQQSITASQTILRAEKRARGVRKLMFWSVLALAGLCLSAIWQDRALAPPVHDGMQTAVALALDYVNSNEALAEVLVELREGYDDLISGS